RVRSPMPNQALLEVFHLEWISEQWVLAQIQHAEGEIIARAPVRIDFAQLIRRKRVFECDRIGYFGNDLIHNRFLPKPVAGSFGFVQEWQRLTETCAFQRKALFD